ncbi:DDE domain protein [Paraburkholderia fungorum]|uniref:DDE domain protein n=1 Tax=Paraburkholderia fungorum TaxID=134537 RepID=A0AAU8SS29_9BURK|nr:DDE domain protein [Paraburkholderia fungorum]
MIDRDHALPVTQQARLVGISRSSAYYQSRGVSEADLKLMRRIDELHLEHPFAGARMLPRLLRREGIKVGRRHVSTLMKRMGVEALYRKKVDGLLPEDTEIRSSKYLNNLIEQDHRNIKSRTKSMLGFKRFRNAAITLAGIELMHRIRKGQFGVACLLLKDAAAPAVWNAVLSTQ